MHDAPRIRAHLLVRTRALLVGGAVWVCSACGALAQATPPDTNKKVPAPFFTGEDALIAAGFAVGTVAFFPLDETIAKKLQNPNTQANKFFNNVATDFEWFGSTGPYIIGGTLFIFGKVAHKPDIADLGWHGTESAILASVITVTLKGMLGRSRPFVTNDTNPRDFRLLSGFGNSDRQSFPSGHSTTAFAAAAAVTSEARRHWPNEWWSTWLIGPAMYGGASMVGLARMYHNKHWGSDVVLGAAVGTFTGRKVVSYSHSHPKNFIDRVILRTSLVPDGHGGARVGLTFPAP